MASLDYIRWDLGAKKKRWDAMRVILATPWTGDRGWEGRTIGLHLPLELRNYAIKLQEKLGLKSMKEILFKALIIGLKELDAIPAIESTGTYRENHPTPIVLPLPSMNPVHAANDHQAELDESDLADADDLA